MGLVACGGTWAESTHRMRSRAPDERSADCWVLPGAHHHYSSLISSISGEHALICLIGRLRLRVRPSGRAFEPESRYSCPHRAHPGLRIPPAPSSQRALLTLHSRFSSSIALLKYPINIYVLFIDRTIPHPKHILPGNKSRSQEADVHWLFH